MSLRPTQQKIEPDTLYRLQRIQPLVGANQVDEQIAPNIEVFGAAVSIWGSQVQPDINSPTATMFESKTGFLGIEPFGVIPNYFYVEGAATSIILTGVRAEEVVAL